MATKTKWYKRAAAKATDEKPAVDEQLYEVEVGSVAEEAMIAAGYQPVTAQKTEPAKLPKTRTAQAKAAAKAASKAVKQQKPDGK